MVLPWLTQIDILTAFSCLGWILVFIPLYWHLEGISYSFSAYESSIELVFSYVAWNVGCVLHIFWVGGQCFIQFVDLVIWRENAINKAPVWCDIS